MNRRRNVITLAEWAGIAIVASLIFSALTLGLMGFLP